MIKLENIDCLELLKNLDNEIVDLTITSPPYNLGKTHHTNKKFFKSYDEYIDEIPENEYQENQIEVLNEIFRVTKDTGSVFYNHKNRIKNGKQITPYEWLFKTNWILKQELVWWNGSPNFDKCRFFPQTERIYWLSKSLNTCFENTINQSDVIRDLPIGTSGEHKRTFPLIMVRRFINCFPDSKIILDPYTGSGTTAIACIQEKKDFIGSEISTKYFNIANKKIKEQNSKLFLF